MQLKKKAARIFLWSAVIWTLSLLRCMAEPVIDPESKGSLTILKYENASAADTGYTPLPDVTYTIRRIAEIIQTTGGPDGQAVSLRYRSFIRDSTSMRRIIEIPEALTDLQELSRFVNGLQESADPTKRIGNLEELDSRTGTTDAGGMVSFEELPLGIWMIYEETVPSLVIDPQGLLVSIPYTSSAEGECGWSYHLTVRPKNSTETISVEKHIIAGGEAAQDGRSDPADDILTNTEDFQIGDTIRYWVRADIPQNIGALKYFFLEDRLGGGQTFINDTAAGNRSADLRIWGLPADGGDVVLIPRKEGGVENWRVSDPSELRDESDSVYPITEDQCRTFRIYFNTQSLSRQPDNSHLESVKRVPLYRQIWVTYSAILNEQAVIGAPGNPNDIALIMSHTTENGNVTLPDIANEPPENEQLDIINVQCPDTRVYTYQANIEKQGEGGASMQGVQFELRDSEGTRIALNQDQYGYYPDPQLLESRLMRVGENQSLVIRGLDSGVYQLVETKTLAGFELLQSPVILTITSDSLEPYPSFQYREDPRGAYFRIEEGRGYYTEENGIKIKLDLNGHRPGDYLSAGGEIKSFDAQRDQGKMDQDIRTPAQRYSFRFTEARSMTWKANYPMENGVVFLSVYNHRSFSLPATGGSGISMMLLLGLVIITIALGIWLYARKRRDR